MPSAKPRAANSNGFRSSASHLMCIEGAFGSSDGKESAYNARDLALIPGLGRSLEKDMTTQLQYSCLENPMNRGAWWATVPGVTKSWTQLSDFHFHFDFSLSEGVRPYKW